jgi:fatty-acyl-CoA synthase
VTIAGAPVMPIKLSERAHEAYRYPLLVRHLLHAPLATSAGEEIVYRDQLRCTYADFRQRLGRLAGVLASHGVEAGTTVAVMDWDSHRYLECFFAIPMMGAILQTVNVRLTPDQIAYTLRHAGAEVILVHRDFVPMLREMRGHLPAVRAVLLIGDGLPDPDIPEWALGEYENLLRESSAGYDFADFDENAVATTFYTTGTTGDPKGVCFTHRQLVLHTLAVMAACGSPAHGQAFRRGDVYMPLTPMFHVHAWGNPFVATALGVKQVYPGRYVPEEILALRRREGVTYSHCVPTILRMLLAAADAGDTDLRGWKMCIGGSALPAGLAREALAHGIDIYAGYGMSETGPVMTVTRLDAPPGTQTEARDIERRCRTGVPVPLVELKIVDTEGRSLPHDDCATGEIVVRAPWLTQCYVGNPTATEELWRGGYLHTQDVARIDAHGYVQITDRIKDVIKTGGEWLSSLEIEDLVSRHPDVAEVAVIAVRDDRWGERPHVIVVARPGCGGALMPQSIRDWIANAVQAGSLPRYAVPERVTITDALPRTSVGKLNKRALRDLYY